MAAAKIVLEPIFEADFLAVELRVPTKRSTPGPWKRSAWQPTEGALWVLDADIKAASTRSTMTPSSLRSSAGCATGQMLSCSGAGCERGSSRAGWSPTAEPAPRRARPSRRCWPTSPSTSSTRHGRRGHRRLGTLVRYCGRLRRSSVPPRNGPRQARDWVADDPGQPLGLRLHPEKTRVVLPRHRCRRVRLLGVPPPDAPRRAGGTGRWYLQRWPSARAMASIRSQGPGDDHSQATPASPMEAVVDRLNPVLRGWGAYFRHGNSSREVHRHRQLREPAAGAARQPQARTPRLELDHPVQLPVG